MEQNSWDGNCLSSLHRAVFLQEPIFPTEKPQISVSPRNLFLKEPIFPLHRFRKNGPEKSTRPPADIFENVGWMAKPKNPKHFFSGLGLSTQQP